MRANLYTMSLAIDSMFASAPISKRYVSRRPKYPCRGNVNCAFLNGQTAYLSNETADYVTLQPMQLGMRIIGFTPTPTGELIAYVSTPQYESLAVPYDACNILGIGPINSENLHQLRVLFEHFQREAIVKGCTNYAADFECNELCKVTLFV